MNYSVFQEAVIASLHLKLLFLCHPQDHTATAGGGTWATTAAKGGGPAPCTALATPQRRSRDKGWL